ncbi:MAG TPA: hypothetical protein VFC85_00690 [Verrucomicrobiae bacterium]|nr:hypothetical protein [Verrucomicrobiae bacterium]
METEKESPQIKMRYVAFCDMLGFGDAVENRFDQAVAAYSEFIEIMHRLPAFERVQISIYSDSILIVGENLSAVVDVVNGLWLAAFQNDWMIRGGIAYGRYWEKRENGDLCIISDALVRAVKLEASVGFPAVVFSKEIKIDSEIPFWAAHFINGIVSAPALHFRGLSFVNPFNKYWLLSAKTRAEEMFERFPEQKEKYEWFIALANSVQRGDILIPKSVMKDLLEKGIITEK